jgi:hypothetical protein
MISLNKGVHLHSFSDHSGCVFFNAYSGETVSVLISEAEITNILSSEKKLLDYPDEIKAIITSLINKNIIASSDIMIKNAN